MKRTVLLSLFIVFFGSIAFCQQIRTMNKYEEYYSSPQKNTLKIFDGKIWINGNLMPKSSLPYSLHKLPKNYQVDASFFGLNEFVFYIAGKEYCLKGDKIIENKNLENYTRKDKLGEYFYQLKKKSPELYYSKETEKKLEIFITQKRQQYYQTSLLSKKSAIKSEIKTALELLFDIQINNQQKEINLLKAQLDYLEDQVQKSKKNRDKIIAKNLYEVTK